MSALKRPTGLGRGLDALLGDAPKERPKASEAAGDAKEAPRAKTRLPVEFLTPGRQQPRRIFADDAIDELAASIRARGLLQPILVRPLGPDRYEIVAGERRWRAAQRAKLHEVPVIIRELTDEQAAEIGLIENVQRVDLNPVEEARAYQRLAETYKRTHEEIAKAVGKSRSHVANTLRLLALPDTAIEALLLGGITAGHARALLAAPEPQSILLAVLKHKLSVRETERLVYEDPKRKAVEPAERPDGQPVITDPKKAPGARKDADTRALEADLAAALGLEVSISHSTKGSGSVTVRYLNLDQLDEITRRLTGSGV
jgi:ParB family chromosome partitioning protein